MKNYLVILLGVLFFTACKKDDLDNVAVNDKNKLVVQLYNRDFESDDSRSASVSTSYDFVDFYIMDEDGKPVSGIVSEYMPETSELVAEGLREGKYTLLILAANGDIKADNAKVYPLSDINDKWLEFPSNMDEPLSSEYFYKKISFEVTTEQTADGIQEVTNLPSQLELSRIVGRMDFVCVYNNPYVRTASTGSKVTLSNTSFYTTFSADGSYSGVTDGHMKELDLDNRWNFYFLPSVNQNITEEEGGKVVIRTRSYKGQDIQRSYSFQQIPVKSNRITKVNLKITHPDDSRGTLFVTKKAFEESKHMFILQDNEPASVYTDPSQRSFSALNPLQLKITSDNKFHFRFYSPRKMENVLIKALIPSISKEYIDFAYIEEVPAFGDSYLDIPLLGKTAVFYTESGQQIRVDELTEDMLKEATFKIESEDELWQRLKQIKYNYSISSYSLYGGDPTKDDGGAVKSWKGIRPVHCREAVAFILNYAFMVSLDTEMEKLMNDNKDKLYDDAKNPVSPEKVLSQMRQGYALKVGLVNQAYDNTVGLAATDGTYGVAQNRWVYHYDTAWGAETMCHELGHVMGYGHDSSFTYGPWAKNLMNHFYINNLSRFPIDSPDYLNSRNNPNLYATN